MADLKYHLGVVGIRWVKRVITMPGDILRATPPMMHKVDVLQQGLLRVDDGRVEWIDVPEVEEQTQEIPS